MALAYNNIFVTEKINKKESKNYIGRNEAGIESESEGERNIMVVLNEKLFGLGVLLQKK